MLQRLRGDGLNSIGAESERRKKRMRKLSWYMVSTGIIGGLFLLVNGLLASDFIKEGTLFHTSLSLCDFAINRCVIAEHLVYATILAFLLLVYNVPILLFLYIAPSKNRKPDTTVKERSSESLRSGPESTSRRMTTLSGREGAKVNVKSEDEVQLAQESTPKLRKDEKKKKDESSSSTANSRSHSITTSHSVSASQHEVVDNTSSPQPSEGSDSSNHNSTTLSSRS